MGLIEIHPRTIAKARAGSPSAQRRFLDTPDTDVEEALPALGEEHPDFAAMVATRVTTTTFYNNDPQQTLHVVDYEHPVIQ
tara:strand:+ start:873 stop:1115 length:243 start_codon:yes stop_codon:yes gene_type:complete